MSKKLILAEKPSVGRDIARVLKCHKKANGYLEGQNYIVTWALGHLVTLADPEKYDARYQQWRLDDLPIMPQDFELVVIPQTGKQYQTVKQLMHRNDVNEIIIATDAGREGELVARWIIEKAHVRKPIQRLWISSVTDKAILDGFNHLKDGKHYIPLYHSALARSEADWYVGINATRALTCKYNAQLSCGRVQTPTLALIAKREEEINQFKPKSYYGITAHTPQFKLVWQDPKTKDQKSFNEHVIDQIIQTIKNKEVIIEQVSKSNKKQFAPQLYDLTELQRDANQMFQYSAKETLKIIQSLYEHHKVLTYPRTDSRYLTTDLLDTIKDRLNAVSTNEYRSFTSELLKKPIKSNPAFINNQKVTDHHAIIPTEERPNFAKFNDRERKIYDLVVKRFLAVLSPPLLFEQVTVSAKIGNETFIARGKTIMDLGWKAIYQNHQRDEDSNDDQILPSIKQGDRLRLTSIEKTKGETKPPAYFTEATLLSMMENPARYMTTNNQELLKTIGDTGGLGTVATRADIIEKLFNTFLIEKKGNFIFTTSKGKQLLELVPEEMKSPELTAKWEQKLSLIAANKLNHQQFISEVKQYAIKNVNEIKNSDNKFKHDNITGKPCPDCGKLLLEVNNKNNNMLVCQDRACGYRKVVSKLTNARCPNCHKRLELYGEGEGQTFGCKCGFREKLSTFNERKKKESKNLSKKETARYIQKINKESDVSMNSALQDALKNFKVK